MKNFKLLGLFAILCMFLVACEEDPIGGGGGTDTAPTVILLSETGFVSNDAEIPANSSFSVKMDATQGTNLINAATFTEDGLNISSDRLTVNGDAAGANPKLVVGDDTNGFTWIVDVDAQLAEGEARVYTFIVQDTDANSDSFSITVTGETGGGGGGMAPGLTIDGPTTYLASPGVNSTINIIAAVGSTPLNSIGVLESSDGVNYDLVTDFSIFSFGDLTTPFSANPHILSGSDRDGFAKPVYIEPDFVGTAFYRFVIEDEAGLSVTQDFTVESGSAFDTTLEGVLLNAGGPIGTGGLDLDTGTGTGSSDAEAEIKDTGIDGNGTWLQKIAGINGNSVRKVNSALPDNTGYADITYKELVGIYYDASPDFGMVGGELVSDVVAEGDIFVVRSAAKDYFVLVKEVNATASDNKDNYVLEVKF